jgi:hypothetical protein
MEKKTTPAPNHKHVGVGPGGVSPNEQTPPAIKCSRKTQKAEAPRKSPGASEVRVTVVTAFLEQPPRTTGLAQKCKGPRNPKSTAHRK